MPRKPDLPPRDQRFRPKLGRIQAERPASFLARVLAAKELAGFGARALGDRPGPARPSVGRGGVAAWRAQRGLRGQRGLLGQRSRRVIVKARIVRHGPRMAPLRSHLTYLRREGVTRDGHPARMFDSAGEEADAGAFAERAKDDRHHFRFIVSPEDAADLTDLRAYTRDLVGQMERDLGTGLDWIAVDHWNTDNPHVHLIVRGRQAGSRQPTGRDLVIHREYITSGLRARAQELATIELGPRAEHEIRARLADEVARERWTRLDRTLQRAAGDTGVIDLRPERGAPDADPRGGDPRVADRQVADQQVRGLLIGRLQRLDAMGLARRVGPAQWRLADEAERTLRDLGRRGDIIRTMNQALGHGAGAVAIHEARGPDQKVIGRVAAKGLDDELAGRPYLIVEGIDGRAHYVRPGAASALEDVPIGGIVRAAASSSGRFTSLRVLSDLPIEGQVTAPGATWLDRNLVGRDKPALAPGGFGGAVQEALDRRTEHLIGEGMAVRRGQRVVFAADLLGTLERRELDEAARSIAAEQGLTHRAIADGESARGLFRQRVTLASGRFALLVDEASREFSLVPWRPDMERALGRDIDLTVTGRSIDWRLGPERGLEIG